MNNTNNERRVAPDRRTDTLDLIDQLCQAIRYMVNNGTTREAYRIAEKALKRGEKS